MSRSEGAGFTVAGGDATALADQISAGAMTCAEAMAAAIAAACDRESYGAICQLEAELGMAAASALDKERRDDPNRFAVRPFAGVPTLAKDLGGPFKGFPVRAGSRLIDRPDPSADSDLAERFRNAGFNLFGLTTSPEFGLSLSSEPARGPLCRNPLDPSRTAGGSSGGAACAVALGIVALAHATDAGGSIRVPAACCGLVGLKPTRGTIPAGPGFANHLGGIASELAVCRSVRDVSQLFDQLRGRAKGPYADPSREDRPKRRLRIGVLSDTGTLYPTESGRLEAVVSAVRVAEADGHEVVPIEWSALEASVASSSRVFADIVSVNLASLADTLKLDLRQAEPLSLAFAERGRALSAPELWQTLSADVHISRNLWTLFESIDCLLTPMLACAPPPLGSFSTDHSDTELHLQKMAAFAPLASLANVSGFPALTLPFGCDRDGLPLPIQIFARMGEETTLFRLASRLEAEDRWRHPYAVAGLAA